MVASTGPGAPVGRGDQGVYLGFGEEGDDGSHRAMVAKRPSAGQAADEGPNAPKRRREEARRRFGRDRDGGRREMLAGTDPTS